MARTEAGAALTKQHYEGQVKIRVAALRDFFRVVPLWQGDISSFNEMVSAAVPLLLASRQLSAAYAGSYFQAFRVAEGVGGSAVPLLAEAPDLDQIRGALYVTGERMTREALLAGKSPEAAMRAAHVRMSGSVGRNVLRGGAETIIRSTAADKEARGWGRVTGANPCAFCAMLAGRGAVYSEDTADFESHDHCTCGAAPMYGDARLPGRAEAFKRLYDEAIADARAAGELRRGTSNDLFNAFRRRFESTS
jgi:hypothetical protein